MDYRSIGAQRTVAEMVAMSHKQYSRDYLPIWRESYIEGVLDMGAIVTRYTYNGGVIAYVISQIENRTTVKHWGFAINETLCTMTGLTELSNDEAPIGWTELAEKVERPTVKMLRPNPNKGRFGQVKMKRGER